MQVRRILRHLYKEKPRFLGIFLKRSIHTGQLYTNRQVSHLVAPYQKARISGLFLFEHQVTILGDKLRRAGFCATGALPVELQPCILSQRPFEMFRRRLQVMF